MTDLGQLKKEAEERRKNIQGLYLPTRRIWDEAEAALDRAIAIAERETTKARSNAASAWKEAKDRADERDEARALADQLAEGGRRYFNDVSYQVQGESGPLKSALDAYEKRSWRGLNR